MHLNAAVEEVYNTEAGVAIKCVGRDALVFDYVIFASQANQALRMLRDPSPEEVRADAHTSAGIARLCSDMSEAGSGAGGGAVGGVGGGAVGGWWGGGRVVGRWAGGWGRS